ncbi:DUF6268 family outer membrane beta-barrel protein [Flavobacterium sp.]|uniref:DUF6268 family outer membrane beta-barrel protein n=1 Tax=Flavobacterium sp. TaxID=239 RepID=UPI003263CB7A
MNKHKYLLLTAFLFANTLLAQDRDILNVNYAVSTLKYNDTAAKANLFDVKLKLPVFQKKQHTIVGILGYKNLSLHNFPADYTGNLHGLTLQGAWIYKLSDRKSLTFFGQAGLFSDLQDVSGKDFRYTAGLRYRVKHSEKFSTGWGLAYSRQFFGNQVIPFIDVDYKPNDKWSITGQFPIKPKVLYHFNNKWSAGIELSADASSYRLSATESNNQYIQVNQWIGLAKLEYQFAKRWQLNIGIGKNIKQSYKLYDEAASTPWTIITIPLGKKPDPIYEIDSKGLNFQVGISLKAF